ncbi:MAG: glycosyltransferase family 39 protein [Myxococcota bacterium]|nr:glycosyltransferase family 39 protein [Myxococcota bacterium]
MTIHASKPTGTSVGSARWPGLAAGLLGAAYVLGVTFHYPVSVSPDGTYYLEMASGFQAALGPRIHDGSGNLQLVTHWPPFYPLCVAMLGSVLDLDPLAAARMLAALVFGAAMILVDKVLVRIGSATPARCLALAFLLTSLPFVIFTKALSDGLSLVLLLSMMLLLMRWQGSPRGGTLVAAGIVAGAMVLTRYAAAGLVGGAGLFLLTRSAPVSKRLGRALAFGVPALLLAAVWVIYVFLDGGESNRRSVAFHLPNWQHAVGLVKTGLLWLSPAWPNMGFFVMVLIAVLGGLAMREHPRPWLRWRAAPFPLLAWLGGAYFVFLLFSITFIDFYTPLNYRILAPVFVCVVFFSLPVLENASQRTQTQKWVLALLVLVGFSYLVSFAQRSEEYFRQGNHYTSEAWIESPTLSWVQNFPLEGQVYTNGPDPIRLHHRRYNGLFMLPARVEVTSQQVNPEFSRDMEELHLKLRNGRAVVVYFDTIERRSLPSANDLLSRFSDIPSRRFEDGLVIGRAAP